MLLKIYETLLKHFGPQGWWPMQNGFSTPEWEVCVGAILTQNTSWSNVEKALGNLKNEGILNKEDIKKICTEKLAELIRPAGYYNQKSRKLKMLASFNGGVSRNSLLGIWGIGRETADSILLYAYGKPCFVVDAYTKRIFSRLGLVREDSDYESVRKYFESGLPKNPDIYKEFHALIVRLGKDFCRKKPSCSGCPLVPMCRHGK